MYKPHYIPTKSSKKLSLVGGRLLSLIITIFRRVQELISRYLLDSFFLTRNHEFLYTPLHSLSTSLRNLS
jgi:hypothetical protein